MRTRQFPGPASGHVLFDRNQLDEPRCQLCGCTADNACCLPPGEPCTWAAVDLCTVCLAAMEPEHALAMGIVIGWRMAERRMVACRVD